MSQFYTKLPAFMYQLILNYIQLSHKFVYIIAKAGRNAIRLLLMQQPAIFWLGTVTE